MTSARDTVTHLVAGGVGGTVGAIVTCPLEVVKTRLQSSSSGFEIVGLPDNRRAAGSVWQCLRQVLVQEGVPGLFRGLGPNLVGVAPSRAIYFWAYSSCKSSLNRQAFLGQRDTPLVHITSAATAGCVSSVTTNPIWVVKTRLQLDREQKPTSLGNVIKQITKESGVRGFYLGLTASIYGISETVVHFVVYEHLKKRMSAWLGQRHDQHDMKHFLGFMACGAVSKTGATCLAYPHGKFHKIISYLSDNFFSLIRSGTHKIKGARAEVSIFLANHGSGLQGGGQARTLQGPCHQPDQADPQHGRHDGHLRAHGSPHQQVQCKGQQHCLVGATKCSNCR